MQEVFECSEVEVDGIWEDCGGWEEFDVLVDGDGCEGTFEYVFTVRGEGFFEPFGDLGERFVGNTVESWGFAG